MNGRRPASDGQGPRIVVTRFVFEDLVERLAEVGTVVRLEDGLSDTPTADRALADADALVCQLTDPIDTAVLDRAPHLRVVSTISVGVDHIDVEAASSRGITVTHTPGVLTETTADFTWALLLATARRVAEADRFTRDERWSQWELDLLCGHDVHGRTLGIIGLGRIGAAVARRAQGFGMTILYSAPRRRPREEELGVGVEYVSKEELLERSHFVSLHLPLEPGAPPAIGRAELDRMRADAILINTARGGVVDQSALIDALERRTLAGAGLDVFEDEPHVPARLRALDHVVLAPHIASASIGTRRRMATMAIEDTCRVLSGEAPEHPFRRADAR